MNYRLFETSYGVCGIAWSNQGLTHVQLPESTRAKTEARLQRAADRHTAFGDPDFVRETIDALSAYFSGVEVDLRTLPLDDSFVPSFNAAIYRSLRQISHGTTVTYGDLARGQVRPGAARAVGVAMSRNPWPIIVPCHRVVGADGKMTGFSAHGGVHIKTRLLAMEGALKGVTPDFFDGEIKNDD